MVEVEIKVTTELETYTERLVYLVDLIIFNRACTIQNLELFSVTHTQLCTQCFHFGVLP